MRSWPRLLGLVVLTLGPVLGAPGTRHRGPWGEVDVGEGDAMPAGARELGPDGLAAVVVA